MGDIYLVESCAGNSPNVASTNGFRFTSKRLCTNREAEADDQFTVFSRVAEITYSRPVICEDDFQFFRCRSKVQGAR